MTFPFGVAYFQGRTVSFTEGKEFWFSKWREIFRIHSDCLLDSILQSPRHPNTSMRRYLDPKKPYLGGMTGCLWGENFQRSNVDLELRSREGGQRCACEMCPTTTPGALQRCHQKICNLLHLVSCSTLTF